MVEMNHLYEVELCGLIFKNDVQVHWRNLNSMFLKRRGDVNDIVL